MSPGRSLNRTPIFQMTFALHNTPWEAHQLKGLEVEAFGVRGLMIRVRFDLEIAIWERDGQLQVYWMYNRDLFDRWRIEQMAVHYVRVLDSVFADTDQAIARLNLLKAEERKVLLDGRNQVAHPETPPCLPHDVAEARPSSSSPSSHCFSRSAWFKAHPEGDIDTAVEAAIALGFEVID